MTFTDAHALAGWTLQLDHLAAQTVGAFAEHGIPVILLKGASFAQLLYPEGGRAYGDVDLLVPRTHLAAAQALLEAQGFMASPGHSYFSHAVDLARRNPRGLDEQIDLHWTLPGAQQAPERVWSQLSRHTRRITVGGRSVDVLDDAGCALHVALHAAQHGDGGRELEGTHGRTGMDLDRAVRTLDLDTWQRASALARALDVERGFAFGLRQTPGGAAQADLLGLTTEPPASWALPGGVPARGAGVVNRILCPGTARERFGPALRALLPPASICTVRAGTRLGRRHTAIARLEWWWGLGRDILPAVRAGRRRTG
jgi:hypothetical protein